jgi:hypothetical protein
VEVVEEDHQHIHQQEQEDLEVVEQEELVKVKQEQLTQEVEVVEQVLHLVNHQDQAVRE